MVVYEALTLGLGVETVTADTVSAEPRSGLPGQHPLDSGTYHQKRAGPCTLLTAQSDQFARASMASAIQLRKCRFDPLRTTKVGLSL
jgi:hypothetical protein